MPDQALTAIDARILAALQDEGRLTNQDLAERVGMSTSPCWRRVRQMEEQGLIQGYRAMLDRRRIGLGVLAFVRVKIDSHSESEAHAFERDVLQLDDVVACYSIAGDADFLLQVASRDLDTYADFAMAVIRRLPGIKEMQTMFVLKEIKPFAGLPVTRPLP
ncbi:Lrp/AsnC family transcriptional regulator [Labrys wisconsinensis]|uniref:DNA-binding Lrp family transcriptional regulator n=1 Tax=Labrys wisconsinensis TaxID=425677 RepID=A0ABU0J2Y7_9HYPH|nr:Lrp/AsnC family transcriptional regulator [Labrys wisconsinensis]MDQ0468624.1 DNA-binding Lrp family transcriptional regulator [Labrys wisconsinensis]